MTRAFIRQVRAAGQQGLSLILWRIGLPMPEHKSAAERLWPEADIACKPEGLRTTRAIDVGDAGTIYPAV